MRVLLLLLAVPLLLQDPDDRAFRRRLELRNGDDEPLATGSQVSVKRPERMNGKVEILHKGRRVSCWSDDQAIWFRTAAPIDPFGSDDGYEVRYGKPSNPETPHEVF